MFGVIENGIEMRGNNEAKPVYRSGFCAN